MSEALKDQLREMEDELIDVLVSMQQSARVARRTIILLTVALILAFSSLIVVVIYAN